MCLDPRDCAVTMTMDDCSFAEPRCHLCHTGPPLTGVVAEGSAYNICAKSGGRFLAAVGHLNKEEARWTPQEAGGDIMELSRWVAPSGPLMWEGPLGGLCSSTALLVFPATADGEETTLSPFYFMSVF